MYCLILPEYNCCQIRIKGQYYENFIYFYIRDVIFGEDRTSCMRHRCIVWYYPSKIVAKSNRHVVHSPVIKHNVWHPHSGGRNTYSLEATIMGSVPYKMGILPVLKRKWGAILLQNGIISLKFPQHLFQYSPSRTNLMCCEFKCWSVYYRRVLWGTYHTLFVARTYLIFSMLCWASVVFRPNLI